MSSGTPTPPPLPSSTEPSTETKAKDSSPKSVPPEIQKPKSQEEVRAEAKQLAKKKVEEQKAAAEREYKAQLRTLIQSQFTRTCNTVSNELLQLNDLFQRSNKVIQTIRQSSSSSQLPPSFQWTREVADGDTIKDQALDQGIQADCIQKLQFPSKEQTRNLTNAMLQLLVSLRVAAKKYYDDSQSVVSDMSLLNSKARGMCQILEKSENVVNTTSLDIEHPDLDFNPFESQLHDLETVHHLVTSRINDLCSILGAWKERLRYDRLGQSRLHAPSFDSLNRTVRNLTNALINHQRRIDVLTHKFEAFSRDSTPASGSKKQKTSSGLHRRESITSEAAKPFPRSPLQQHAISPTNPDSLLSAFSNIRVRQLSPSVSRVSSKNILQTADASPFSNPIMPPSLGLNPIAEKYAPSKKPLEDTVDYLEQRNRRTALRKKLGSSTRPVHVLRCDVIDTPSTSLANIDQSISKLQLGNIATSHHARDAKLPLNCEGFSTPSLDRIYSNLNLDKNEKKLVETKDQAPLTSTFVPVTFSAFADTTATTTKPFFSIKPPLLPVQGEGDEVKSLTFAQPTVTTVSNASFDSLLENPTQTQPVNQVEPCFSTLLPSTDIALPKTSSVASISQENTPTINRSGAPSPEPYESASQDETESGFSYASESKVLDIDESSSDTNESNA